MHGLNADLREIEAIAPLAARTQPHVDILICPPATLLAAAARTAGGRIAVGGQDCHPEASGAHTGDISAEMLKDAGASAVIVGHSERRQHHGETDAIVTCKALAARLAGLLAIVCVGETQQQRMSGAALSICAEQIVAKRSQWHGRFSARDRIRAALGDRLLENADVTGAAGSHSRRRRDA
jgi:triosephosphate isomerase